MARIVMAWELGGGMGHVVPLSQIAQALVARGHDVHFVLRDLSGAAEALRGLARHPQVRLWQAPVWLAQLTGAPLPVSYAELLFRAGYLDARRLSGLADAWRSLFDALQPQLLVADHAPTALLAARGRPMARALVGTGFFVPPATTPMPAFRDWDRPDAARLTQSEARALASCNALLASWQQPPMDTLQRLTEADEQFLLTWPELDHYSPGPDGRPGAHYWGSLAARDQGSAADWPAAASGPEHTLFAYLKADYGPIEAVLQALQAAPLRTLVHVAGLRPELRRRFANERLRFSDGPVAMSQAMAGASAVLCHAGSGTVCTALQAGLPVLMLPMHAEQLLFARRVVDAGAGIAMVETSVAAQLAGALARLVQLPALRAAAQALAARQQARQYGDVALQVALRCEALANGH